MADRIIQRVVFPREPSLHSLYYRLDQPRGKHRFDAEAPDRRSVAIGRGAMLITDTYFNSFFECYWRRYTRLGRLRLRLRLSGAGAVLLLRRSLATGLTLLESVDFDFGFDSECGHLVLEVPGPRVHFRELGA